MYPYPDQEMLMNKSWRFGIACAAIVGILLFLIYVVVPMLNP